MKQKPPSRPRRSFVDRLLHAATGAAVGVASIASANAGSFNSGQGASSVTFSATYPNAILRTVGAKLAESASVMDFGAKGDGVTDDSGAFSKALAAAQTVTVPPGTYYFAAPATINQGNQLVGEASMRGMNGATGQNAAILLPATCALTTPSPLTQLVDVTIHGLSFIGGTTQVDLGLWHDVTVRDCEFAGFSVAGLCIVRGEKQRLDRLRFDFTTNASYGLCFGYQASINYAGGLYAGQNTTTFFGAADAFMDRVVATQLYFQAGAAGTWTVAAITSRIFSGSFFSGIVTHGLGTGTDGELLQVLVRLQTSKISTWIIDNINGSGSTNKGFDVLQANACTLENVSTSFAGNSNFTTGFNFGTAFSCTFINCSASGNNSTTYGFLFGSGVNQQNTLIDCSGAIYCATAGAFAKGQFTLLGCNFTTSNLYSGSVQEFDPNNEGINHLIMADANGTLAATALVSWLWAVGSGQVANPFTIGPSGPRVPSGFSLAMGTPYGGGYDTGMSTGTGSPNGAVTANVGSIYLNAAGGSANTIWIKESGHATNTGWVAK